jgi:hypothetical protein
MDYNDIAMCAICVSKHYQVTLEWRGDAYKLVRADGYAMDTLLSQVIPAADQQKNFAFNDDYRWDWPLWKLLATRPTSMKRPGVITVYSEDGKWHI